MSRIPTDLTDEEIEEEKIKTPILIMQIRSGCEGLNLQQHFNEIYFVSVKKPAFS